MTKTALPAKPFHLAGGSHGSLEKGACFNELVSVLAGEPFSDSPKCVDPIIRRLGMSLNDRLDDDRRQLLRPFVLRSLGTADDGRQEERRQMCNEWLLHNVLPDLLEQADRKEMAEKLRALPADLAVENVRRAIREARDEAWNARRSAVAKLRDKILAELPSGSSANVAAAVAVAAADAAAAAAAVAAADADAAADAAAVAVAAADAAAVAVAVADAAAAADADAVAAAAADAAAAAAAVAAAVAVAVAVAVAAADAAAVAAADAAAAAVAAADADAAADAAAVAVAAAVAKAGKGYWQIRTAVYNAVREKVEGIARERAAHIFPAAIDLLDRMLPPSPLLTPVVEHADVICAAPEEMAA